MCFSFIAGSFIFNISLRIISNFKLGYIFASFIEFPFSILKICFTLSIGHLKYLFLLESLFLFFSVELKMQNLQNV